MGLFTNFFYMINEDYTSCIDELRAQARTSTCDVGNLLDFESFVRAIDETTDVRNFWACDREVNGVSN